MRFTLAKGKSPIRLFELIAPLVDSPFSAGVKSGEKASPEAVIRDMLAGLAQNTSDIRSGTSQALFEAWRRDPGEALTMVNDATGGRTEASLRFNVLKRDLDGITQTALTNALRRLERNGIVERRIVSSRPIGVEYAITPLGHSLGPLFKALDDWTHLHLEAVETARAAFAVREQV